MTSRDDPAVFQVDEVYDLNDPSAPELNFKDNGFALGVGMFGNEFKFDKQSTNV